MVIRMMVAIGCNAMVELWLLKHGYIVTTILHTSRLMFFVRLNCDILVVANT